ncbi:MULTISPECIES: 3-oxoacyl-ACP reductase FabG [Clostridium]|uniref:3-oxoacyl-ACP reductase FabG n=1 Tax=Clostridium aquiflavi TaxID=3073603 RepID=A0ABU1EFE1_9CLOT|nr:MULTISPECIES: 3-oxoacyl-ACP reductase FabG [unclassified Clostridium]MDR5587103.1 3-oxoacyl-ACP reductase FabG [Clostridium sp. 5N-1]NFG61307.1 SDR family oxidoreductase [Clostridium botulinum]NFQ09222.1 SDR family oxidoreductase [Clostridium botulinum]
MCENIKNQIAVITGGGSGIGRDICIEFAKRGIKVMITGRRDANINETKKLIEDLNGYAETYKMDVSNKENVESVFKEIYTKHGKIDILINNAGLSTPPTFCTNMSDSDWDSLIKTHLYGAFYCSRACAKFMKNNNYGRIVNMSSIAGVFGFAGNINYSTAKTALVGFTYSLAKELGSYGITVNAIQPGIIRTSMTEEALNALETKFVNETPLKKIGEPKDIASAVSFLCSPDSGFITGVILRVDGGYILNSGMDILMMQTCSTEEQ